MYHLYHFIFRKHRSFYGYKSCPGRSGLLSLCLSHQPLVPPTCQTGERYGDDKGLQFGHLCDVRRETTIVQ